MINVILKEYWSKADAFLLPLVGVTKNEKYKIESFLFWENHSIQDYKLTLSIEWENYEDFHDWCLSRLFPVLDKKGYLLESHDYGCRSVFVLDVSEWAMDIEMFLAGRYSQFTRQTVQIIESFHVFNGKEIPFHIYASLHPTRRMSQLTDGKVVLTPIEYVAKFYEFDLEDMKELGEVGGVFIKKNETLTINENGICQDVSKVEKV